MIKGVFAINFAINFLRIIIGWHLLYEGLAKFFTPGWSSLAYLLDSGGPLAGIFLTIADSPWLVAVVDFINIWCLIIIGLGLILGLGVRTVSLAGLILLAMYYLSHPPLPGIEYQLSEYSKGLIVNQVLIESAGLLIIFFSAVDAHWSIERLMRNRIKE